MSLREDEVRVGPLCEGVRCADQRQEHGAMAPDPEQFRAFAERYTAAWCSMDPAAVAAHYAPEDSLAINGGAPAVGRDDITRSPRAFTRPSPDMQVFFDDLVVGEERIEYHCGGACLKPGIRSKGHKR
jgi:hypothetical protein